MKKTLKKLLKPILLPPYRALNNWCNKDKLWLRKILSVISPVYASKKLYKRALGKNLNLKDPQTLNEKCLWLKLNTYYNNPLITECCDKYLVRDYVKSVGCEEILNDLIGVWDNPDDIDFDKLPNKFALKCNHGCGYNIICSDKSKLNVNETKEKLRKWLKEDYWKLYAETQYKFIKKKIICEKFIESNDSLPVDYKFFCVNGNPECVMVCKERASQNTKFYYFDRQLNYHPEFFYVNPTKEQLNKKIYAKDVLPQNIEQMFSYAEKLSKAFPFVRVDLYENNDNVVFGEFTFLVSGGFDTEGYAAIKSNIDLS